MSILFGPGEKPFQNPKKKSSKQNGSSTGTANKLEELLVFGYECKFFRDDTTADDVNSGKTLIPWMGHKDLMIDRYDCRGHLYKLEDFDFSNSSKQTQLSTEEMDIESILDEERYKDLNYDTREDEILEEEAEKRSKSLYDPYTAYQSISYSYGDNSSDGKSLSEIDSVKDSTFKQYCKYYGYDENDSQVRAYFNAYQKQQEYESSRPPPPPPPNPPTAAVKKNMVEEKGPEPFLPPKGIEIPSTIELNHSDQDSVIRIGGFPLNGMVFDMRVSQFNKVKVIDCQEVMKGCLLDNVDAVIILDFKMNGRHRPINDKLI